MVSPFRAPRADNRQKNITPRYEFGFGLSYTTFEYSGLAIMKINPVDYAEMNLIANWENGGASPIAEGSSTALWSVFQYDNFMSSDILILDK